MHEILLTSARLVTPDGVIETDILVRDGLVAEIGTDLQSSGESIDCAGGLAGPGLVDRRLWVHQEFSESSHQAA